MTANWFGNRKVISGAFGAALLILILLDVGSFWSMRQVMIGQAFRRQSRQLSDAIEDLQARLYAAETGQRGFLLTGDESYLKPYYSALSPVDDNLRQLDQFTAHDPLQQQDLFTLKPLIAARIAEMKQTIDVRRSQGLEAASRLVLTNSGRRTMDEIRDLITVMNNRELAYIDQNMRGTDATARQTNVALLSGGFLSLAFLSIALFLLNRDSAERLRAAEALKESERLYRGLFDASPLAIHLVEVICDAEGRPNDFRFLYVNPAFERMTRRPAAEFVGHTVLETIPQVDRSAVERQGRVALTGVPDRFEGFNAVLNIHWEATSFSPRHGQCVTYANDVTERKRAEEALRESEARLKEAQHNAHIGSWRFIPPDTFIWSDEMYQLFKSARDVPVTYAAALAVMHPEDQAGSYESGFKKALESGVADFQSEFRVIWPDGQVRWMNSIGKIRRDAEKSVIEATGTVQDITDRVRAEEAIRESEEKFRALANGIPQLCWMADAEGWIHWYNQRWYDYTGTTPQQMEGWGWQSVHDPEALPAVLERWKVAIASGKLFDMVFPLRGADGVFRPFLTRVMPIFAHDGKLARWFGTNTDITEQRKVEEALRRSEERNRTVSSLTSDYAFEVSIKPDGTAVHEWISGALSRILGYSMDDLNAPGGWEKRVYPEDIPVFLEHFQNLSRDGTVTPFEYRGLTKLGEVRWLRTYELGSWDESRTRLVRLVGAVQDITERKLAEEALRRLNEELEERVKHRTADLEAANRELEAFTYSVSHDLRAPLRHIDGFSKLLSEEHSAELTEEGREYITLIRDSTKEMGQLVDDLLNLARVGRKELTLQVTGLRSLVDEVVDDLKRANPQRAIDWKLETLPFVECDPGLLKQVFANLLSNSVKFTRPRERADIEVGTSARNGDRVVFVRDNGVGFSMKSATKLFGVFQRLHRQEDFEGTGVGLATVQRIIHKHGGRVWAEAELNHGATFYFTLGNSEKTTPASDPVEGGQK